MATRAELQERLAAEFGAQSWPMEIDTGPAILDGIREGETPNPQALAARVPAHYLTRHGMSRQDLADAIGRALGGRTLEGSTADARTITIQIFNNQHSIQISGRAKVNDSQLNTGNQLILGNNAPKQDVLAAVATLVNGGVSGEWNSAAAADLARAIESRDDIGMDDIRQAALEAAGGDQADKGRIRKLLEEIAVSGLGGALSTGITAALGGLL